MLASSTGLAASDADHDDLADRVAALGRSTASLAGADHAGRLLGMIRRPGWTTRREAELVGAAVAHLHAQVGTLARAHDDLLAVADRIGRD